MLTTLELKTPIQGHMLLVVGRYPGGQPSLHACNPALTVGYELTSRVDGLEEPAPDELVFKESCAFVSQLVAEGVIPAKPKRQLTQKGIKFVAYHHSSTMSKS